nr:hypothetical protein [Stackebrandtia endophytica]
MNDGVEPAQFVEMFGECHGLLYIGQVGVDAVVDPVSNIDVGDAVGLSSVQHDLVSGIDELFDGGEPDSGRGSGDEDEGHDCGPFGGISRRTG